MRAFFSASPVFVDFHPHLSDRPFQAPAISGLVPAQIRQAYGFNQLSSSANAAADGSGQTIAIVEAYGDPTLAADLKTFDQQFSLGDPALTQVNLGSSATIDTEWSAETALDAEWAHAIAPSASLLVVNAASSDLADLYAAVNTARSWPGVSVVSMSWGGSEFRQETGYDSVFTTPANHPSITFVASSGDDGASSGPQWPAASSNVLSVGGTQLTLASAGQVRQEQPWDGSSGGVSPFEPEPSYQLPVQDSGMRLTPDVAYNADPNTGYDVYCWSDRSSPGWQVVGGTSAGAPQWAALVAIADQSRAAAGLGTLDGKTQTLPALYQATGAFQPVAPASHTAPSPIVDPGYHRGVGLGSPQAAEIATTLAESDGPGPAAAPVILPTPPKGFRRPLHHHLEHGGAPQSSDAALGFVFAPRPASLPAIVSRSAAGSLASPGAPVTSSTPKPSVSLVRPAPSSAGARLFSNVLAAGENHLQTTEYLAGSLASFASIKVSSFATEVANSAAPVAVSHLEQAVGEAEGAAVSLPAAARRAVGTFIHANALAAFSDATAAFIQECATLPRATPLASGRARAWVMTAGVLAADALLVAHWYATRPRTREDEVEETDSDSAQAPSPFFLPDPLSAR